MNLDNLNKLGKHEALKSGFYTAKLHHIINMPEKDKVALFLIFNYTPILSTKNHSAYVYLNSTEFERLGTKLFKNYPDLKQEDLIGKNFDVYIAVQDDGKFKYAVSTITDTPFEISPSEHLDMIEGKLNSNRIKFFADSDEVYTYGWKKRTIREVKAGIQSVEITGGLE